MEAMLRGAKGSGLSLMIELITSLIVAGAVVIPTLGRVGTELKVPLHFPSGQQTAVSLTLGYQDDGFSDNGYYAHDNGDDNQCSGIGPAWVEITATTNVQSSRVKRK